MAIFIPNHPCEIGWYQEGGPCASRLQIFVDGLLSPAEIAINFDGRGFDNWNNGFCGTSADTYITKDDTFTFGVDVWRAYQDGIWTSSVAIQIAVGAQSPTTRTLTAFRRGYTAPTDYTPSDDQDEVTKSVTPQYNGGSYGYYCAGPVKATVTVNDDGTFSIA
jgi:hypothetical protein